jgi:tripartite ATP-independent transporter DctP family solute receptor
VIQLWEGRPRLTNTLISLSRSARQNGLNDRLNTDIPIRTEPHNPLDYGIPYRTSIGPSDDGKSGGGTLWPNSNIQSKGGIEMKRTLTLVLAALFIMTWAGTAPAQYKATMKLASVTPTDHFYNVGARKFADLIKERTQGRIEVKVYPAQQLGKGEREITEAVQQGAVDMLITSTGPMGGFSPSINILDFPFLFGDFNHVDLVMDGTLGRKLLNDFDKAGIKALAFWENGFRHLTNNKKPVIKVDDGKGFKIRTMENKVHLAAWKTAGFNPTPMAWGEVFTALQQGVIDGQENPIAIIASNKLWDAGQKFFSFTAHVYSPAPLLLSLTPCPKKIRSCF